MDQNSAIRRGASSGARFALTKFRVPILPGTLVIRSVLHDRLTSSRGDVPRAHPCACAACVLGSDGAPENSLDMPQKILAKAETWLVGFLAGQRIGHSLPTVASQRAQIVQ